MMRPDQPRDAWARVAADLRRRRLFRVAVGALVLVYGLAVYAPLVANDRPYYLVGVDRAEYTRSQLRLVAASASLADLAEKGRAAFEASLAPQARIRSYGAALAAEAGAIDLSLTTMRAYLPDGYESALAALRTDARELVAAASRGDATSPLADAVREGARALRQETMARTPERPDGVALVPRRSFPLFEAISGTEVFFMVLWLFVLSVPWWAGRVSRRSRIAAPLGASLVAAVAWSLVVGGHATFESSPFKERLTRGDLVAERVVMPPLAMGFAEIHASERSRPPTWSRGAEIDEAGHYVRGARAPREHEGARAPAPVEVRYGEPGRNSPLRHPLGTDAQGRDLLVRLLWGGRVSLAVGLVATVLLVALGLFFGALAGYLGGRTDLLVSRLIEVVQAFPAFFLILTAVAVIPDEALHPVFSIVLVMAVVRWTGVARLVRGECLRLREQEFVLAARALGFPTTRVVWRHVLPNAAGPVLVAAAFAVATGILTESAISFLGLGVKLPVPSWGSILSEARSSSVWWIQVFPGALIFVTVLCYNLVGEVLRDALDPKSRGSS